MPEGKRPVFSELSRDDAIALLARNHVGRLAYAFRDRVDIEPISYVLDDAWLYARTSPGAKLAVLRHHPFVAFEVDEVKGPLSWESVVVRGTIYFLEPDRSEPDREVFDTAVELLQKADADALTDADATPHRQKVFRIHVDEVTGRRAELR